MRCANRGGPLSPLNTAKGVAVTTEDVTCIYVWQVTWVHGCLGWHGVTVDARTCFKFCEANVACVHS